MLLILVFLIYPIVKMVWKGGFDIKTVFYRACTSFVFLIPSFCLLSESRRQREIENKYREVEIKLAIVEPYFKGISDGTSKPGQTISDKDIAKLELAKELLAPEKTVNKDKVNKNRIVMYKIAEFLEKIVELIMSKFGK
jgi:hypothetical protein